MMTVTDPHIEIMVLLLGGNMNERIKELAEQAGADFMRRINYNNLEGKEYEEDAGVIFESNELFEKFAELIVKECCDVLQNETIMHDGYGYSQGFLHKKIKEHFGVE